MLMSTPFARGGLKKRCVSFTLKFVPLILRYGLVFRNNISMEGYTFGVGITTAT